MAFSGGNTRSRINRAAFMLPPFAASTNEANIAGTSSAIASLSFCSCPLPGVLPAGLPETPAFQRPGRLFFDSVILVKVLL
jgi:hypothetical protein